MAYLKAIDEEDKEREANNGAAYYELEEKKEYTADPIMRRMQLWKNI